AARRVAFARYDLPTAEYLMSKDVTGIPDVLITAAAWHPAPLLNRWLESGANVNATNPAQYGRTPLLTAVTSEAASADTVKRLLDASPGFREKTNCISCHHNTMPALAAAAARKRGIQINEERAAKNLDDLFTFFKAAAPRMMMGDPAVGGEALTAGYAQMAFA